MHRDVSKALFEAQTNFPRELLDARGWTVLSKEFPVLDVVFEAPTRKALRVRMICEDWNDLPPSIELLNRDGEKLKKLPTGSGVLNSSPHPSTGASFICSPGSREYHTHGSHTSDLWENYKQQSGYSLGEILTQIHGAWLITRDE